ncbi:MAG TPA: TaqI-like C-terminal specificity domain-containing protein [Chitinophagaceae bacterium]
MFTKEEAYAKISDLVERFSLQIDSYKKSDYNETLTRQDFINPFFKALGWDIDNSQGNAEAYREVIHEDKLRIGSATKAPDYSFRLPGGKRLFFVEAKKPSVAVKDDIVPAYQVRRYGWSAKLPISLITDFEELAVYDCTKKPKPDDKASTARIKYITYNKYLEEFDFIWDTFSKASVLKGSFDKFIVSDTYKKGTTTVDKEFLASLDEWRILLAQNIALRNQNFTEDELNFVVQQTLDRIIFLRIAEDRGVEGYGELKDTLTKSKEEGAFYKQLFTLFKEADSKYNSGLFDFKKDKLSANVIIDNKVIKTIISELYYPVSPYEFSVLGVEILGSAYEQFLGKQIKLSAGHKAIIEEKPEVRKAGGVYYTPQYIVDYIVQNTVGKLTESKTPEQVAQLKIVDPACGSGSFLIGAYKYLLNWHLEFYKPEFIKHSETAADTNTNTKTREAAIKQRNKLPLTPEGNLTTALKKQILLNNIYGVDIDTQAVEVTKLSLLLKCMEGETGSSINAVMRFGERVLPTLDDNIKSGNSLIDVDFYGNELFEEEIKIKPYNWQKGFPNVFNIKKTSKNQDFKNQYNKVKHLMDETIDLIDKYTLKEPELSYGILRGFDIVIGNPPYGAILSKDTEIYLRQKYSVANYQLDTYNLFIERGLKLLRTNGLLGYIIPSAWVASAYDNKFRRYIAEESSIKNFVVSNKQTFKDATVETCILILENTAPTKRFIVERWDLEQTENYNIELKQINAANNYVFPVYANKSNTLVVDKIKKVKTKLNDIADVVWGAKIYENGKGTPPQKGDESKTKKFHSPQKTKTTHRPLIGGSEINRYQLNWKNGYVNYGKWLAAPRNPHWFEGERIVVREVTSKGIIQATYLNGDYVFSNSVDGIKMKSATINIRFLLGLINSKLISFYHLNTSPNAFKGTFPKMLLQDLRELPIPIISSNNKSLHDEIVQLAETMLQLNKEKQQATTPDKLDQLKTRIQYTDDKINKLVYQLYGLSEEEIGIVEG